MFKYAEAIHATHWYVFQKEMIMEPTTLWSEDRTKSATIFLDSENVYGVHFIRDCAIVETRYFPGKSVYYAESAAHNWTIGILNL